jgi:preprotein translocase subunit SecD
VPRSLSLVLVSLLLAALMAACAEPEAGPETVPPEVATVLLDLPGASPEQMNAAAEVVRARVQALDLQLGEIGWDDAAIEVIVPAADEQLVRAALLPNGDLELRPVLAVLEPSSAPTTTPPADRSDDQPVVASDGDGVTYQLGPVVVGEEAIESASATSTPDEWTVDPVFRAGPDGIDAFNAVASACFTGAETCPAMSTDGNGMVAILLDGTVVVAPTINVASFERDQIQISSDFDETSARGLAAALSAGAAPMPWTVRD